MHHRLNPACASTLAILAGAICVSVSPSRAGAQPVTAPGSPAARPVPEDVSLPIDAIFRDLRLAYAKDAVADKIAVTVRERDRMPQTAVLVLRIGTAVIREEVKPAAATPREPVPPAAGSGAAPAPATATERVIVERKVRAISVEAGDLRLHVLERRLVVILASNPTTYFAADLEEGPITPQLTSILGPLPLLPLMLADWKDGEAFPAPVPQVAVQGASWFKATTRLEPAGSPILMLGTTPFGPMSMQIDGKTFRPTQALVAVSPAPRSTVMELELTSREPGDPAKWEVSLAGRTRVGAISQLAKRIEPPKPPADPAVPSASPDAPRPAAPAGP